MAADFLEFFTCDKFDDKKIIKKGGKSFSVLEIKAFVKGQIDYLKTLNKDIAFNFNNNFDFIINFLACIFAKKNIIITNSNSENSFSNGVTVVDKIMPYNGSKLKFDEVNPDEIFVFINTSGSSSSSKTIKKSLRSFLNESRGLVETFNFKGPYEFITTAEINHLFALTFYLFLPLNSMNLINADKINYPEEIKVENAVFATSPSFLKVMEKYNFVPEIKPLKIISAGAKFEDNVFQYAKTISDETIDIYGSTETGVIAYRTSYKDDLTLFNGVELNLNEEKTEIESRWTDRKETLGDRLCVKRDRKIEFLGRTDRVLKVQEKRVSAFELEEKINSNKYIEEAYCMVSSGKIAVLCALNNGGIEKVIQDKGPLCLIKELKNELSTRFNIIPQIWKFIDILPKTPAGKIDKIKIQNIFNQNLSLPLIVSRKIEPLSAEFDLFFYKGCNFFKGHFEGFPITPGVVQLFYADWFTKIAFGIDCSLGQLRRIKFKSIIFPNRLVKLKLFKKENGVEYEFLCDDVSCSSGNLPVKNMLEDVK